MLISVFVHGWVRFHGPHARAAIPSTVRIETPTELQNTLRYVPVLSLGETDLLPGPVLLGPKGLFVDAAAAVVSGYASLHTIAMEVHRAGRADGDLAGRIGGAQQTTPFLGRRIRVGVVLMLMLIATMSCPGRVRIHVVRHVLLLRHRAHLAHATTLLADHALETAGVAVRARGSLAGRGTRVVAVVAVDATVAARGIHDGMTI